MISDFRRRKRSGRNLVAAALLIGSPIAFAASSAPPLVRAVTAKPSRSVDDSLSATPAPDLALRPENARKADALAAFLEGQRLEENAELDAALAAYEKVLNADPGAADLASRVATLLTQRGDYPRAVDVLKDAIKANPNTAAPYIQLAFIYAKFLRKIEQARKYAAEAVRLQPDNIEAYQRLCEIELTSGDPKRALAALDRARNVNSDDADFWIRLGKLYAAVVFKTSSAAKPPDLQRVDEIFAKALAVANDDADVLSDAADYYVASQQVQRAIPIYLRVLGLKPDDASVRQKLASSFAATNQRSKAIELLQQLVDQHPEKFETYDLLAQLLDDDGRELARAKQTEKAKTQFAKAAAIYEQSLLVNASRPTTSMRLAELLIGALKQPERALQVINEAKARFPAVPEFTYLLALAQRESKNADDAVATFEEALHEAQNAGSTMVNARFYFDYAVAADQAGLHDKAADLLRQAITLDPTTAAEAWNYLGYMWAEQNSHLEEAEDAVQHALQLDPNNGAYLDSLGWVYYRREKYQEALDQLLRAAQLIERQDPVVFEHIGDAYAKLNRMPQALDYWGRALAADSGNKSLAEKIDKAKTKVSKGLGKAEPRR